MLTALRRPVSPQDKYLHTNCLAALANMSAEFRQLHPFVCQRLVSLLEQLAKRHGRQLQQLQAQPPPEGVSLQVSRQTSGEIGVL